jgi:hypothetical protein
MRWTSASLRPDSARKIRASSVPAPSNAASSSLTAAGQPDSGPSSISSLAFHSSQPDSSFSSSPISPTSARRAARSSQSRIAW